MRKSTVVILLLLAGGFAVAVMAGSEPGTTALVVGAVYLACGVGVVVGDHLQPRHNRPFYVREGRLLIIPVRIVQWPLLH